MCVGEMTQAFTFISQHRVPLAGPRDATLCVSAQSISACRPCEGRPRPRLSLWAARVSGSAVAHPTPLGRIPCPHHGVAMVRESASPALTTGRGLRGLCGSPGPMPEDGEESVHLSKSPEGHLVTSDRSRLLATGDTSLVSHLQGGRGGSRSRGEGGPSFPNFPTPKGFR